jgi:hypothetical protein
MNSSGSKYDGIFINNKIKFCEINSKNKIYKKNYIIMYTIF